MVFERILLPVSSDRMSEQAKSSESRRMRDENETRTLFPVRLSIITGKLLITGREVSFRISIIDQPRLIRRGGQTAYYIFASELLLSFLTYPLSPNP
jgi:hypothetical protein